MGIRILIVEDEFIVANDLSMILEKAGYSVCDIASSVAEARTIIAKQKPQLVLLDIHLEGTLTGIDLAKELLEDNIAFVYLSANSNQKILELAKNTQPYGFLVKPFREKDVLVSLEIAQYLHNQNLALKRDTELALESVITDIIAQDVNWEDRFLKIAKAIQPHIPFDFVAIGMKNLDNIPYHGVCFLRLSYNEYQAIGTQELMNMTGIKASDLPKYQVPGNEDTKSSIYNLVDFEEVCKINPSKKLVAKTFGMSANLVMFIPIDGRAGFTLSFYNRKGAAYHNRHLALVNRLQKPMSQTFEGVLAGSGKPMKNNIPDEVSKGRQIKVKQAGFAGIIGKSHLLLTALDHLTLVAPMETSVLILGESGTGKERFAKSIHELSSRNKKPIVVVNCAALPTHLIESELFGHEKGAFTGAVDRRIGKFEQASGGSIFLDEMGELPLESQAKLLRVLQEKEIERLGGRETIQVDVRIIAATNCNLEKEVAAGRFRLDLYYRLNVFPIILPPLRDRKGDIPILAAHFLEKYAAMAGKSEMVVSSHALQELEHYSWPGNVRELEHIIERNVLLSRGNSIDKLILPNGVTHVPEVKTEDGYVKSIDENERDYILSVLKKCGGRISGPGGAADLLDVPATTLNSKMKRLGIVRKHVG
ncbi:sigma 54-interacting transcriptional regulator [Pedobacter metabolipauper]|uniref:Formate hydrogenlyase transcriptional activator n=1 Tax=Pedobacter metabolipauper TaxID=425513 RepID=A0A4R6T305_9SPHI|nr:sigma 54-interacting transcriptional regulator [Pedobacter metabolipauper]TDQ12118.1 formate hydrogenlyase transcriptional activator [Pedobacter metabolipauper]